MAAVAHLRSLMILTRDDDSMTRSTIRAKNDVASQKILRKQAKLMPRYEFSFVVTDVELPPEVRERVGRAVATAGATELGAHLPEGAVSAPALKNEFLVRYWCGYPPILELPEIVNGHPDPPPWLPAS